MKILIYNPNSKEWHDFIHNLSNELTPCERISAIDQHIEEIGQEITPQDFVKHEYRYTSFNSDLKFKFIGEPKTPLEKILVFVFDSTSYIHMQSSFPEDFCESRTDWDSMIEYADEMSSFIKELMEDLAK